MSDNEKLWSDIDQYFADLFVGPDATLTNALADSSQAGLPDIAVAPNQGKLLQMLVRLNHSRRILEVGTLGGYSTIWMARALPTGGKMITLELDAKHVAVARANFDRAGLASTIEVREGAALVSLEQLVRENAAPFDFVFIDADKANIPAYFEYALKLTRPGSLIIVDNVVRKGAVIDANSSDPNVIGVRRFNQMAAADSRVTTTVIQTVGSKGHDGLAIMMVLDSRTT